MRARDTGIHSSRAPLPPVANSALRRSMKAVVFGHCVFNADTSGRVRKKAPTAAARRIETPIRTRGMDGPGGAPAVSFLRLQWLVAASERLPPPPRARGSAAVGSG